MEMDSIIITRNDIITNPTTVIPNVSTPLVSQTGSTTEVYVGFTATSICTMEVDYNASYSGYGVFDLERLTNSQNVDNLYAFHFVMQDYIYEPGEQSSRKSTFQCTATTCNYQKVRHGEFGILQHGCQRYYMYYTTEDGETVTPKADNRGNVISTGNTSQFGTTYLGTEQAPTVSEPNRCVLIFDDAPTKIGDYAFFQYDITSIELPDTLETIGKQSFSYTKLESLTIPGYTETLEDGAFTHCNQLTAITIPDSVTTIGSSAFGYDFALQTVLLGNSLQEIKDYTFTHCGVLTGITIPDSVTSIGYSAFTNCSAMTYLNIGSGVTSIGEIAFKNCSGLTTVTIPNSVTTMGPGAFSFCRGLTTVTLPNNITAIENGLFHSCSSLSAITIPNSVREIKSYAFRNNTSLTAASISDNVRTIGSGAFQECSAMTAVLIGSSVFEIETSGFSGCRSMQHILCKPTEPPTLASRAFYQVPSDAILYVPTLSMRSYEGWAQFTDIRALPGT